MIKSLKIYIAKRSNDKALSNMRNRSSLANVLLYAKANNRLYALHYPNSLKGY